MQMIQYEISVSIKVRGKKRKTKERKKNACVIEVRPDI